MVCDWEWSDEQCACTMMASTNWNYKTFACSWIRDVCVGCWRLRSSMDLSYWTLVQMGILDIRWNHEEISINLEEAGILQWLVMFTSHPIRIDTHALVWPSLLVNVFLSWLPQCLPVWLYMSTTSLMYLSAYRYLFLLSSYWHIYIFLFVNHAQMMEIMGQFHVTCSKISLISRMLKIRTFSFFQKKRENNVCLCCMTLLVDHVVYDFGLNSGKKWLVDIWAMLSLRLLYMPLEVVALISPEYTGTWCMILYFSVTIIFGASKTTLRPSVLLNHVHLWILIYGILYSAKFLPIMRESMIHM